MSLIPAQNLFLEAQNAALREEIQLLRAGQTAARTQQTDSDERELQQARFRTVFETSPLGQKIITPDLVIQQANQAACTMLACASLANVVGHQIPEFAHPAHRADWL